jgi:hypothetical protein
MTHQQQDEDLVYKTNGIVETTDGLVAGFWIRTRRGKRAHLLAQPIKRKARPYRIERKTIMVDGQPFEDVPVKVYPQCNSFSHWNKYHR